MIVLELIVVVLAAYRLTRLVVEDNITEGMRSWIWKRRGPETKIGYLFTCYWCMGFWIGTALGIGYILVPSIMFIACLPLAIAAGVGITSKLVDRM